MYTLVHLDTEVMCGYRLPDWLEREQRPELLSLTIYERLSFLHVSTE